MRLVRPVVLIALVAGSGLCVVIRAADPGQSTFSESFENGSNTGGWSFGRPFYETIESEGGNPGSFYHCTNVDSNGAEVATTPGVESPFVGDYRARGVISVGVDVAVFGGNGTFPKPEYSVWLQDDPDTPADPWDDCYVYLVNPRPAPRPDGRWVSYEFNIPSSSQTLPRRWALALCAGVTADQAWNRVITGVDRLWFMVHQHELIYQQWDVGIDNPTVTWTTTDPSATLRPVSPPFGTPAEISHCLDQFLETRPKVNKSHNNAVQPSAGGRACEGFTTAFARRS